MVGDIDEEPVDYFRVDTTKSFLESGNSVFVENTEFFDSPKVEKRWSYTLDTIVSMIGLNESSIHIIKIDVQGSELKVLRGAKKLLERSKDVIIITEVSFVPYNGPDAPSFFDIHFEMTSMGFVLIDLFGYCYYSYYCSVIII